VAARYRLVLARGTLREHDVIGPEQPIAIVTHFGASTEFDAQCGTRVRAPLGEAAQHSDLNASRVRIDRWQPLSAGNVLERHVELPMRPARPWPGNVRNIHAKIAHVASGRPQPVEETLSE
jgi:hypothetical protein